MFEMIAMMVGNLKSRVVEELPKVDINMGNILNAAYIFAGLAAVGIIIYSGYTYTRSEGDVSMVRKSHQRITYAVIGLVVVLFAALITNFIVSGVKK